MLFEVGGVYGSVLIVPGDKQRSGLHPGGGKSQARKRWSWKSMKRGMGELAWLLAVGRKYCSVERVVEGGAEVD